MSESYKLYMGRRAKKAMKKFPKPLRDRFWDAIYELADDPRPSGCTKLRDPTLTPSPALGYRIRVGDYRIIYDVDDDAQEVTVYHVRHRREAYR